MHTLKEPIEVRGYAMFDKFKLRSILSYNKEIKEMRVAYSYGHLDDDKKHFVPSQFKEHSGVITISGTDFAKIDHPINSSESGYIWDIIKNRIYDFLNAKHGWFRDN